MNQNSHLQKKDHSFTAWYFLVVITYVVLEGFTDVRKYFIWLKPIPVLLLIMIMHTVKGLHTATDLIRYGFLFGMIGDISLEISGSRVYFLIGVGSFFIGHCFLITAFYKSSSLVKHQTNIKSALVWTFIYFLLIAGGVITNLHYVLNKIEIEQKIAFCIYSTFLSFMTISAFLLALKSKQDPEMKFATISIYIGSLLFFVSDVTLSQKSQNQNLDQNSKRIMNYVVDVTYWSAQFLICTGAYKISSIKKEIPLNDKMIIQNQVTSTTEQTIKVPLMSEN